MEAAEEAAEEPAGRTLLFTSGLWQEAQLVSFGLTGMAPWQLAHSGAAVLRVSWQPTQLRAEPGICMAAACVTFLPAGLPWGVWQVEHFRKVLWWQLTQLSVTASWRLWSNTTGGMVGRGAVAAARFLSGRAPRKGGGTGGRGAPEETASPIREASGWPASRRGTGEGRANPALVWASWQALQVRATLAPAGARA